MMAYVRDRVSDRERVGERVSDRECMLDHGICKVLYAR